MMKCGKLRRKLCAEHLLMLTVFLLAYPNATMMECKAFLYINTTNHLLVGESTIHDALKAIGFTQKKMSHIAAAAFSPSSLQRRLNFWTMPYPYGIVGIP